MGHRAIAKYENKQKVEVSTSYNVKTVNLGGVGVKNENKEAMKGLKEIYKHRHNIRTILECSNATPVSYKGIGYTCCFCRQQFPIASHLKKHVLEIHDEKVKLKYMQNKLMHSYIARLDITSLCCTICQTSMDTLHQLAQHLENIHQKLWFFDVKNHILFFKFDDNVLRCAICGKVFHSFKLLREHMSSHYRNYVCTICDSGFVNRSELSVHGATHKMGTFKCDLCPKVFNTLAKKKSHQKSVHIFGHKLLKCGYCNQRFTRAESKSAHLVKMHGVLPTVHKCGACEKTFDNRHAFRVHTKRDHLVERHYKCAECDMTFFKKNELTEHVVKHTGQREFKCDVCGKEYGRKKTLREHMRIHNNDRRFKCKHCGQAFVQKCSWRAHMRNKHAEIV